jgi:hypothetical protein
MGSDRSARWQHLLARLHASDLSMASHCWRDVACLSLRRRCRRQPRSNPKPLHRRLVRRQFPVVPEDDGGGIAGSGA